MNQNKTRLLETYLHNNKQTLSMDESQLQLKKTLVLDLTPGLIISQNELLNNKYRIKQLLTDHSGEADIYIASDDSSDYIVKLYRSQYQYNEEKNKRLKAIQSPYVIQIIDEGYYHERYFEVMPYYKNGDLTKHQLTPEFIKDVVLMNLNEALKAIHDHQLIHKDLKPSNIFLSDDCSHVVLGDFGISSVLGKKVTAKHTKRAKTLEYSAGETFSNIVTSASDYYSLGITIMELLTGKTSYEGLSDLEITKRKALNQLNIPLSPTSEFYTLIKGLTLFTPQHRFQYEQVKRWCNGEHVELIDEHYSSYQFTRPYKFNGKSLMTKQELAKELALNWDEGKKNFIRGYLSDYFKSIDQQLASNIEDAREIVDQDISQFDLQFFKVIHMIDRTSPMIYKGEDLKDVNSLITMMQTQSIEDNQNYIEFIFSGALEYYLTINKVAQSSIEMIQSLRQLSHVFFNQAYYGFLLLNNNNFYYRNHTFTTIEQLIDYISDYIDESETIASELKDSDYFSMWIKKLGYQQAYEMYMK